MADRYTNPENAEAATEMAAAESENAESIDSTVADDVIIPVEETAAAEETAAVEETVENASAEKE